MVLVAGSGGPTNYNNYRREAVAPPPPPPPAKPVEAVKEAAANAQAAPTTGKKDDLVQTAASGAPVEAGKALRSLDQQNGGNRGATNDQVGIMRFKNSFLGNTSLATMTTPVSQPVNSTSEKDGETTTSTGTKTSATSHEGNTTYTKTDKTDVTTGNGSWSKKTSSTSETTSKQFDDKGKVITSENGQPAETVDNKATSSKETKVNKDSLSYSESNSVQDGSLKASNNSSVKVDSNGVSATNSTEVGAGPAKGTASHGVTFGENGLSVNGQVGVGVGPIGAQHKEEVSAGPNGTKTTSTSTISIATPEGKPVSGKLEYKITDSEQLSKNDDGSTTYKVTGETKFTASANVDVKKVEVGTSWSEGQRTVQTVTVPAGTDIKDIDLTNPDSWPEGTRVMTKSEDFKGSTLEASYLHFGMEAGSEVRDGNAIVMEKKADNQMSVAVGPTSGFTTSGKLKLDIVAGFGFELGGQNTVDFAFYKTFDIDLNASGGKQTYTDVLTGQKAPTDNVNGVSNLMETTYGDWNWTGGAKVNTPFGSFGPEAKESSKSIWKTYPDGRVEYSRTYDANGDGKTDLTKTASSVDGKNWDDPVYKFSVEITTEEYSQLHNAK